MLFIFTYFIGAKLGKFPQCSVVKSYNFLAKKGSATSKNAKKHIFRHS